MGNTITGSGNDSETSSGSGPKGGGCANGDSGGKEDVDGGGGGGDDEGSVPNNSNHDVNDPRVDPVIGTQMYEEVRD